MKTALLAVLLLALQQKNPEEVRITLKLQDVTLEKVINQIRKDTLVPVEWSDAAKKQVNAAETLVSVDVQDMQLTGALKLILLPSGLDAKVVDKKKVVIVVP